MNKKFYISVVLTLGLFSSNAVAASPSQGVPCGKLGQRINQTLSELTCTKFGKKLVWKSSMKFGTPSISLTQLTTALNNGQIEIEFAWSGNDNFGLKLPSNLPIQVFLDESEIYSPIYANGQSYKFEVSNQNHKFSVGYMYQGKSYLSNSLTISRLFTPLPTGFSVHLEVQRALDFYGLSYSNVSDQTSAENTVINAEAFDKLRNSFLESAKRSYPGFANTLSLTSGLDDSIRPWAEQIASRRNLPLDSFKERTEGLILLLEKSQQPVDQAIFDQIYSKVLNLNLGFDVMNRNYWIFAPTDSAGLVSNFQWRDSFLSTPDSQIFDSYKNSVVSVAKATYPPYASALDLGQNMNQAMSFWINRFQSNLEIQVLVPMNEPILISAARTQGLQYSTFDQWTRNDPRWQYTAAARASASSIASTILCTFGFTSCKK